MEKLNEVLSKVTHQGNVRFPITENKEFLGTYIEDIDLDGRSYNALKRGGFHTIEDIISNLEQLSRIKNCGTKSINRIMYKICVYYYEGLTEEGKAKYLSKIIELNS